MTTILIADTSKPSIVMTSEVFKDKIQGAIVHVARNGKETLDLLKELKPDMCVIDFDLPDVDGPCLIQAMRRIYDGPILMTAFPDEVVEEAVKSELFAFHDASSWIKKPVTFDSLSEKIDLFLVDGHRIDRRFDTSFPAKLVAKAAGRGKRAPKVVGRACNISIGGLCVEIDSNMKLKKGQELTLTLLPPDKKTTKKGAVTSNNTLPKLVETKIKATIQWHVPKDKTGFKFIGLSPAQKSCIFAYLQYSQQG